MKSFTQIKQEPSILWEDERYLACWKPNNLLVHRTNFDFGEKESLRNYLIDTQGKAYAPLHRLDKPTSGVVLFAKDKEAFKFVQEQFVVNSVEKEYLAIVRGYVTEKGVVDKPLCGSEGGKAKPSETHYEPIATVELDIPVSRYATARYSLVKAIPKTGRYHQIRMHFSHLRHPIVGDRRHGDVKHNKMWESEFGIRSLFLHASMLKFKHLNGESICVKAPFPKLWKEVSTKFSWNEFIS